MNSATNQDLEQKINNAKDIETAKHIAVNSIIPECKETALQFFNCVETKLRQFEGKGMSYQEMEREMSNTILPVCLKLYDIDRCIKTNEKKL